MSGMGLFRMRGAWSGLHARLFDFVISRGMAPLHERIASAVDPRLPPAARILDIGCGNGAVLGLLARRRPEAQLVGCDLSPTMIELARRRHAGLPNLTFREGDAMALPFADGEFDAAMSISSIKHWPDPAQGVSEMARVLRPGGRAFVLEADPDCDKPRAARFVRHWRFLPGPLEPLAALYLRRVVAGQGVGRTALRRWFEAAGLVDIEDAADAEQPAAYALGRKPEPNG